MSSSTPPSPAWKTILALARQRGWMLVGGVAALVAVDLMQLWVPRVLRGAVDGLVEGAGRRLGRDAAIILGLGVGIALLRTLWRPMLLGFSRWAEHRLRVEVFSRLLTLPSSWHASHPPGELMARLTTDMNNIRLGLGMGVVAGVDGLIMGGVAIGFMAAMSPLLTVVVSLPMIGVALLTPSHSRWLQRCYTRVQQATGRISQLAHQQLARAVLAKAFALEADYARQMQALAADHLDANLELAKAWAMLMPLMSLATVVGMALVVGLGGPMALAGTITIGELVAFSAYLGLLGWPMMALGWVVSLIQRTRSSITRIDELLLAQPEPTPAPTPGFNPALGVELKDVSFAYPEGGKLLKGLNLRLWPGQMVGIAGAVGSGKSTLAELLGGIAHPTSGEVLVGGVEATSLAPSQRKVAVGMVSQQVVVLPGSVEENLALAAGDVSKARLEEVLRIVGLHRELVGRGGLKAEVGEEGVGLSGGQRQRLALARALVRPPMVLVLDECLSEVEPARELEILRRLRVLMPWMGLVVISSRLGPMLMASEVYVLGEGRILQQGSAHELIETPGPFRRIFGEQWAFMSEGWE